MVVYKTVLVCFGTSYGVVGQIVLVLGFVVAYHLAKKRRRISSNLNQSGEWCSIRVVVILCVVCGLGCGDASRCAVLLGGRSDAAGDGLGLPPREGEENVCRWPGDRPGAGTPENTEHMKES